MKKLLLLFLLLAVIKIEAQQNSDIEKADTRSRNPQTGKEIKSVELNKPNSQRTADLKKLADELVNAFAIDNVTWSSVNYDPEMAIGGGGAAGKATFKELKVADTDMDGDGHADALRGIEKSDIRRGMKIKSPSQDKSTKPIAEGENQRASGDLKNIFPPGNKKGTGSRFKNLSEITYFAWEIIGADIPNAEYVVEITKIDNDGQPQQTFIGTTDGNPQTGKENKITDKKVAKFKAGKALADTVKRMGDPNEHNGAQTEFGEYKWRVTETTTGNSSNPSFFTISQE